MVIRSGCGLLLAMLLGLGFFMAVPVGSETIFEVFDGASEQPVPAVAAGPGCDEFPLYCVPFAGGGIGPAAEMNSEAPGIRVLDGSGEGADGVVRGFAGDNLPFLGDPDAPVHFLVIFNYTCGHCVQYHRTDLTRVIRDYVMTGQASLRLAILTWDGLYSENAAMATLCAGEQGGLWEMAHALFVAATAASPVNAFTPDAIRDAAGSIGLDGDTIIECVASDRYRATLMAHTTFAHDLGINAVPSVLVSYGDSGEWTRVASRGYDTIKQLIDESTGG